MESLRGHEEVMQSPSVILPLILERRPVRSALDVGCNLGAWLRFLVDQGVDDVLGMDAATDPEPLLIPRASYLAQDLRRPFDLGRRFDLALCLEVAEHVEAEHAEQLVDDLCRHSDFVLWSAALPGQGGDHHVNEQWTEYWIEKFERRGYDFVDPIRRQIWTNDQVYWWYRQNCVVFATEAAADAAGFERQDRESMMFSVIHPRSNGVIRPARDLGPSADGSARDRDLRGAAQVSSS